MSKFASQERQAEKLKLKEWKNRAMQELIRELYIIQQMHEKVIEGQRRDFEIELEGQRQSFQTELEWIRGKLEQHESRSKFIEKKIKALKLLGQHTSRKISLTKIVPLSGMHNKGKREEKQIVEPERLGESQKHQRTKRSVAKAGMFGVINKTQSNILRKSYTEVTREKLTH